MGVKSPFSPLYTLKPAQCQAFKEYLLNEWINNWMKEWTLFGYHIVKSDLGQQSSAFLAAVTGFVEDHFPMGWGWEVV